MDIFISWSGSNSQLIAEALRSWLPCIIDMPNFWMSAQDIPDGKRWSSSIAEQLYTCDFGVLILTSDNIKSPWLLFEAGALSKNLHDGRVIPYLTSVRKKELTGPLSQFQALYSNKNETYRLVLAINESMQTPATEKIIKTRFDALWPTFESSLVPIFEQMNSVSKDKSKPVKKNDLEIEKLRDELSMTNSLIEQLVKNSSSPSNLNGGLQKNNKTKHIKIEGAWFNKESDTHLYIKCLSEKIKAPYCYAGNEALVAEYYDWKKIGQFWFARFRWFKEKDFTGFAFFKQTSDDIMEGKWWFEGTIPDDFLDSKSIDVNSLIGGNPITWERKKDTEYPPWAKKFLNISVEKTEKNV